MTVVTVFVMFFSIPASGRNVQAASKAGAYRAKVRFNLYSCSYDAIHSNGSTMYVSNPGGWVYNFPVYEGQVYIADNKGWARYNFWWGDYGIFNAPEGVRLGLLEKIA